MKDRTPKYPGRVRMIPVQGQPGVYDMVRADEPTEAGTPLNKASLLKDSTAALYGLGESATVNDVFGKLTDSLKVQDTQVQIKTMGVNFPKVGNNGSVGYLQNVASDGKGTVVNFYNSTLYVSHDDGATWKSAGASVGGASNSQILFAQDKFFITNFYSGYVYTSTDGETWKQSSSFTGTNSSTEEERITVYGNGKFISMCMNSFYKSIDGVNWTKFTPVGLTNYSDFRFCRLIYADGKFITSYVNHSNALPPYFIATSTDGETWNQKYSYTVVNLSNELNTYNLVYANKTILAMITPSVTSDRFVIKSTDGGETWNSFTPSSNISVDSFGYVISDSNHFYHVEKGKTYISSDAENWETVDNDLDYDLNANCKGYITQNGVMLVATTSESKTRYSKNVYETRSTILNQSDVNKTQEVANAVFSTLTQENVHIMTGTTTVTSGYSSFGNDRTNVNCTLPVENAKAILVFTPEGSNITGSIYFAVPGAGFTLYSYSNNLNYYASSSKGISSDGNAYFADSISSAVTGNAYYACWY